MKKKSSSQASWSILSEGVSASRVEAHIVRSHVNQMIDAIKEHPQLAEEIFKRCGDNFEAIPKHLSKMERSLDRTNYALITMGSDWYRQRLTHEDREKVDMASKYNPTPLPSISKQSEFEMRKQAGFGRIIGDAIEDFRVELEKLDAEYIDGGDSWIAEDKQEALHAGDFEHARSLTRNRRVKEVIMAIKHRVDSYSTRSASKSAAPEGTPTGVWEDAGDNRKLIKVRSVPSKTNRNDQEKGGYDFKELTFEFVDAIAKKRSDIMGIHNQIDSGEMEIYLFKLKSSYEESVEVSSGHPDGGASYYLWEVYFRPTRSKTLLFKANLRVESLLVAGGSFVDGKLLTESQAKNFMSAAKRNRGGVY